MFEEHVNQLPQDVVSRHLDFVRDHRVVGMRDEFEIDRRSLPGKFTGSHSDRQKVPFPSRRQCAQDAC